MLGDYNNRKEYKLVGRVTSSRYFTGRGFAVRKEFNVLKRKSDVVVNDWFDDLELQLPINFEEVEDGIYEIISVNEWRDYETGVIR